MKTNKVVIGLMIICLVLICWNTHIIASDKKINIKMAAYFSKQSPGWNAMYEWPARMIEKALNGRAKVTIFPSNSLVGPRDAYRAIQTGICDVTWVWGPAVPGAFPLTEIFSLPGFSANQATSNYTVNELFMKFPAFKEQFDPKVKHLITQVHMRSDLHTTIPIRTLNDLKGKVIACQNDKTAKALSLLGASATQMQIPDMYHALERGVVKGTVVAWGAVSAQHLDEVTKYHTLLGIGTGTSHWMWSKKTWDKFTPEEQVKLELLSRTLQNYIAMGNVAMSRTVRSEKVIPEKGHEIIIWSDKDIKEMKKLFKPMWEQWAEDIETKGLPGKEILKEAEALMAAYIYG